MNPEYEANKKRWQAQQGALHIEDENEKEGDNDEDDKERWGSSLGEEIGKTLKGIKINL